jgi:tRNA A37 methylthiotransferase MiaB
MRKVTFVELSVYENILPLVSGYLQAYASTDSYITSEYTFEKYTASARDPVDTIVRDVLGTAADVYAFACYVWNMGRIRSLIKRLREYDPHAHIILGGPQVMHHGHEYLNTRDEQLTLCNGEGEATFAEYLRELIEPQPDLSRVMGLTFCRDGVLETTPQRPRIADLNTIPSPFLSGLFDPNTYSTTVIETNRGCPFACGFCYWGAATNDRVYRFDEERVRDEINWVSRNGIVYMFIADANWGMLGRDIDLSAHIADCAREHGQPNLVYFSAAKNKPKAVTKIVSVLTDAGLIAAQPVSMQTIEPASLQLIKRQNIKLDAFAKLQSDLHERGVSSFIELIWPLPGETLTSFKQGIGTLCEKDAHSIISYGHLLLHNSPLYERRKELSLVTRPVSDEVAEADIVVQTEQVSVADFEEGMRYSYAVQALQNTRVLRTVARYLSVSGTRGYTELFADFVEYWRSQPDGDPIVTYVERSIREAGYYDINNYGLFLHEILHASRAEFGTQVTNFVHSQAWWQDPVARVLFEIDLLNWPYLYSNTRFGIMPDTLSTVCLVDQGPRTYTVEVDQQWHEALAASVTLAESPPTGTRFIVDHKRMQYPFRFSRSLDHNGSYGFGMIQRPENMMPVWRSP